MVPAAAGPGGPRARPRLITPRKLASAPPRAPAPGHPDTTPIPPDAIVLSTHCPAHGSPGRARRGRTRRAGGLLGRQAPLAAAARRRPVPGARGLDALSHGARRRAPAAAAAALAAGGRGGGGGGAQWRRGAAGAAPPPSQPGSGTGAGT